MKKINWFDHIINFLAVIFGVTLAFYITRVSDRNGEKKELEEYRNAIISELEEDIDVFENYQIPDNRNQAENINEFLGLLSLPDSDSLSGYLENVLELNSYNPTSVTFESMKSSGKLNLIGSLQVKRALGSYYIDQAAEVENIGQEQADYFMERLLPYLCDNLSLIGNIEDSKLRGNLRLQNHLVLYSSLIGNKTQKYEGLLSSARELKKRLEEMN